MTRLKLYMILVGCTPKGRNTEQHDVFFGIGSSLKDLMPAVAEFWPETKGRFHLDAWREVTLVDGWQINVIDRKDAVAEASQHLFFINLGGYKPNEMEEFHYKMVATGADRNEAIKKSKATAFFKHMGFKGATSHIDDKYGVDVDDLANVEDILPASTRQLYALQLTPATEGQQEDELHLGYFKLSNILKEGVS
jgi:hypothetical protein